MRKKVFIPHPIPEIGIRILESRYDLEVGTGIEPLEPAAFAGKLRDVDAVVTLLCDRIDEAALNAAGRLKVVANHAVGYENIDVAAARRRRVMVTNTPGVLTRATAEIAFALLITLTRRILEADRFARGGRFTGWDPLLLRGDELDGKTLGIIGMGRIGQEMAAKCRAFGMRIIYHNRKPVSGEVEKRLEATYLRLDELLERADAVSIHCPSTPETRHLLDAAAFGRMKDGAYVVNAARGEIIHEQALVDALKAGKVKGAGLDVYEFEPRIHPELPPMENVVLLPHIGSATFEARDRMSSTAARNVIDALEGRRPPNLLPELADLFTG